MDAFLEPIEALKQCGDARKKPPAQGYVKSFGLNAEHVPDLIRLAVQWAEPTEEGEPELWAPIHAWRALGELRAVEAVEPLLGILNRLDADQDDWYLEEFPDVMAGIGPPAVAALSGFLAERRNLLYPKICVADALMKIGSLHPDFRDSCVGILTGHLELPGQNDPSFNGFLASYLIKLRAVESESVIERAYAHGLVDECICGDWPMVRAELHGEPPPNTPRSWSLERTAFGPMPPSPKSGIQDYRAEARARRAKEKRKRRRTAKARRKGGRG